jgi:hypothetical protein
MCSTPSRGSMKRSPRRIHKKSGTAISDNPARTPLRVSLQESVQLLYGDDDVTESFHSFDLATLDLSPQTDFTDAYHRGSFFKLHRELFWLLLQTFGFACFSAWQLIGLSNTGLFHLLSTGLFLHPKNRRKISRLFLSRWLPRQNLCGCRQRQRQQRERKCNMHAVKCAGDCGIPRP